jgi:hypothetical protein
MGQKIVLAGGGSESKAIDDKVCSCTAAGAEARFYIILVESAAFQPCLSYIWCQQ